MNIPTWWGEPGIEAGPTSSDLDSKIFERREDFVHKDLTRRLKKVCEKLAPADFDALMHKMAREQLRGEGILPA